MDILRKPKVLFVVTEDWYFYTHRLTLALLIKEHGYDVLLATKTSSFSDKIRAAGIRIIPLKKMRRSNLNPFGECAAVLELLSIYKNEKPDVVHHVALKPVIYGSLAAKFLKVPAIVNALGGLGAIFSSNKKFATILQPVLRLLLRYTCNGINCRVILQNSHDLYVLQRKIKIKRNNLTLTPGSGVDLDKYVKTEISGSTPVAILASRMIWDKGVGEFVRVAKRLKSEGFHGRFVLVGMPDYENPFSISESQLQNWNDEGWVEWWGFRADMPKVIAKAWVVCLPTYYGEGVPKVLLEAMASGRPIITTEMPGCQDLVRLNRNGLLVVPRDEESLLDSLRGLLSDLPLCKRMGKVGRKIVETEYTVGHVSEATLSIYKELLEI